MTHRLKYELEKNIKYKNDNKRLFLTAQCDLGSVGIEITIFIRKSMNVSGTVIVIF